MHTFFNLPKRLAIVLLFATSWIVRADSAVPAEKLEYAKPAGVTDKTRVKGGGRGGDVPASFQLVVLAPDHTALTVAEHPSVFWFMNEPLKNVKYELSVMKDGDVDPLFTRDFDPAKDTGIQRFNLGDIPRSLDSGVDYQISVVVIPDAKQRSKDVFTSAIIRRVKAPEKLVSQLLTRPTPAERAAVYARQGMWFDALASISDQIAADPKNKNLHELRAHLFETVGLPEAAAYDKKLASE